MRKLFITTGILLINLICFSQTDTIKKYYSDKSGSKETTIKKAKYAEYITRLNDSVSNHEFINLKTGVTLWRITMMKNHPYGKSLYYDDKGVLIQESDYNFILKYGSFEPDGFLKVDCNTQQLANNIEGKFEMPVIKSDRMELKKFLYTHFLYPEYAVENEIQGTVYVQFTVDKNGTVGNISIVKGSHDSLDFEAFRLIYFLPKLEPAKLNGEKIDIYMVFPINFRLM